MTYFRSYGKEPYSVAVVHGGPGAAGEMAPVAVELSSDYGVLEPWQREISIRGQIGELKNIVEKEGSVPLIMIGFSWGAWLSLLTAAYHPGLVKQLILIGSGPFEAKYASNILQARLNRLDPGKRAEVVFLLESLEEMKDNEKAAGFARLGEILSRADSCGPISSEAAKIEYDYVIFRDVWEEAESLRKSGMLLNLVELIQCPVVAFHGECDPHPAEGVEKPLMTRLKDFRFFLLRNCGHKPWIEIQTKDRFYTLLRQELRDF